MRTVKKSIKQIRRTPFQALAAVFVMALTFLTISVFAFIVFGSAAIIKHAESTPQVTTFFKDEATPQDIEQLQKSLKDTGKVSSMRYVSKKDALEIYRTRIAKNDEYLMELVTEDTLPASLDIYTFDIADLDVIAKTVRNYDFIDDVQYSQDVVDDLKNWTSGIRTIGIVVIVVLIVESIFVMMMVIGFKVSQKRDEIDIMKLLSASNWYIRWPFVWEGIIYGVIGAMIGWIVATVGLLYATPFLETILESIPVLPASPLFLLGLVVFEILIAIFLGITASFLAVRRYLK